MTTPDDDSHAHIALRISADRLANLEVDAESKDDDVRALQEEPIEVTFVLPDDSLVTHKVCD
ncbi:hypothetical protein PINS_up020705 [Pythium insidiosum]|nr:hypothetical protein PINS_up020705 [Pythium insidiosum]